MNLLHIGLTITYNDDSLSHYFRQACESYNEIWTGHDDLNERILRAINEPYDVAFVQVHEGKIRPDTWDEMRRRGIFTVNWCGDIRQNLEGWFFNTGADLTLFSNERDIITCQNRGLKSDFLQIGIEIEKFNRWGVTTNAPDIVFMGNNIGHFPLSGERRAMVTRMQREFNGQFGVYGNGWHGAIGNLNSSREHNVQKQESIIYNNAKIAINHSHFNVGRYTSDRLFRILGSGCACLSHNYIGIGRDFETGKHLDTYNNLDELVSKCRNYLQYPEKRQAMADAGFDHCMENFTYKNMVENLFNLVEKYK